MNYQELKAKAKELGLPVTGTKAELEARINEHSEDSGTVVAQIMVGGNVLREYTQEAHGKNFVKLAEEMASQKDIYSVNLIKR